MSFGVSDETVMRICEVLARFDAVEEAVLYGSRAMGTQREGSDIDLTLKGEGLDVQALGRISNALDELLLPYRFDLSIYDMLQQEDIREHIGRVGVSFYKKGRNSLVQRYIDMGMNP